MIISKAAITHFLSYPPELVVEFAITSYTVSEGAGFVGLEVVKWGETSSEIVLNFTLGNEGDSAEGMDAWRA